MRKYPHPSVITLVAAPWLVVGGMALAALVLRLVGTPDPHDELLLKIGMVLLGVVAWPIVLVCWTRDLFTMRRLTDDTVTSPEAGPCYMAGDRGEQAGLCGSAYQHASRGEAVGRYP